MHRLISLSRHVSSLPRCCRLSAPSRSMAKQPGARRNPRSNTRKRVGKGAKPTTKLHLNPSILYPTQYRESLRGFPWCNTINCRKSVAGVLVFCFGLVLLCVGFFVVVFFGGEGGNFVFGLWQLLSRLGHIDQRAVSGQRLVQHLL